MKTTIYELLGMIKDNKAPKKILFKEREWAYNKDGQDYSNKYNEWLFDDYLLFSILKEPVEILETTITYNQDNTENNKQDKKIKKLEIGFNTKLPNGAETENIAFLMVCINWLAYKTNEIIDRYNNER